MKKKIIIFIAGLMALDLLVLCGTLLGCHFFRTEIYSRVKNMPQVDLVVLGSSHAHESLNSEWIEKSCGLSSYNLGGAGHNPILNEYLSRNLVKRKIIPKTVVLVLSYNDLNEFSRPHLLSQFVPKNDRLDMMQHLMSQKKWLSLRHFFYGDLYSSSIRMILSRSIGYIKSRSREIPDTDKGLRGYGGKSIFLNAGKKPEAFIEYPFEMVERQKKAFAYTINIWKKAGARVLVVDTPEFIGTRLCRGEYDKYQTMIRQICEKNGAIFKSFNQLDMEILQNEKNFRDGGWGRPNSHLNTRGGKLFNQKFSLWLKELGIGSIKGK